MPSPFQVSAACLAGFGDGPESPDFLSRGLIERRQEAARTVLAAARAGHHQVAHGERRGRGEVVQMPVRHLGVPNQFAGEAVQRDQVGVVGGHEDTVARRGHAAIGAAHGGGRQAGGGLAAVMPDLAAGAGVQRITFVGHGNVHDAAHHDRRHLQARRVRQGEDPLRSQARDVGLGNLRQGGVAVAAGVAVVAGPIGARRDLAKLVARAAQQVHAMVAGAQLQIVEALIHALRRPASCRRWSRLSRAPPAVESCAAAACAGSA